MAIEPATYKAEPAVIDTKPIYLTGARAFGAVRPFFLRTKFFLFLYFVCEFPLTSVQSISSWLLFSLRYSLPAWPSPTRESMLLRGGSLN